MRSKLLILIICLTFSLSASSLAFAKIDLTFSQPPASINSDQSFSIEVTLSGVEETSEYYLRGVFFSLNTSNYFGFTKNLQEEWITASTDFTQFYKIIGNNTVTISFKPDPSHHHFSGQGSYHFKVGRYTPAGSITWSDQSPSEIMIVHTATPTASAIHDQPSPTPITFTPTPQPTLITLSEIYACPPAGAKEWIEIKNNHDYEVTLTNWLIRDNTSSNKSEFTLTIPATGVGIVELNSSLLNNTGDSVKIINQSNQEVSSMSYSQCSEQASMILVNTEWVSTLSITKGSNNVYVPISTPASSSSPSTPTPLPTTSPSTTPSSKASPVSLSTPIASESTPMASISGIVLGNTVSQATSSDILPVTTRLLDHSREISPVVLISLLGGGGALVAVGIYIIWEWYNQRQS